MTVLNAFQLVRPRAVPDSEKPLTKAKLAEQTRRANEKKRNPGRVVRVVDVSGRAIPFERKNDCFFIEGSLSAQQTTDKRREMRKARI
jgi:hypothetical protein